MASIENEEKEVKKVLAAIEIIHKELIDRLGKSNTGRLKNYEHITTMTSYANKGFTVEPTTMDPLLEREAKFKKTQKKVIEKLLQMRTDVEELKDDLRDLEYISKPIMKKMSIVTNRNRVWMKESLH